MQTRTTQLGWIAATMLVGIVAAVAPRLVSHASPRSAEPVTLAPAVGMPGAPPTTAAGLTQRIAISGTTPVRVVFLPTTQSRALALPLRPRGGTCTVAFDITPSRKPATDPRTLGVHIQYFKYVPAQ